MVKAKSYCETHLFICTIFTIVLLCACGFLFYAGWWLPIAINNHRLRHNQLVPFEIYNVKVDDWYKYSIPTERISVLTYRQQQSYNYKFLLGSFQPSNFSLNGLELLTDGNVQALTKNVNVTGLIPVTWASFAGFVNKEIKPQNEKYLRLTMYSSSKCIDPSTNSTEIYDCFRDWVCNQKHTLCPKTIY